jgi:peptidoglycan/xylan/chitin deacetylase (PgdA/CDA1 family)
VKSVLKRGLKALLRGMPPKPGRARILTYHSVGERRHEMNVRLNDFEEQMAWLDGRVPVIPLEAAIDGEAGVAITFDDGFVDNLRHAAPVLQSHGFPATVFMVAGRAGSCLDGEPDPRLGRLMDWEELAELAAMGIEVGGHTLNHPRLARLDARAQRDEIAGCRDLLEQKLQRPVRAFAYPYGSALDYNAESMAAVREAGYAFACSNRYGPVDPDGCRWEARRIWIDATDSLPLFVAKVTGRLDTLRWLDSPMGIRLRRTLNGLRGE